MMNHVDEFTLNEYLDEALPDRERLDVEAHLAVCAACQAELAELQQLFLTLTAVSEAPFTVDMSAAVKTQIEQEKTVGSEQFSVNSGLLLLFELVAAGVLLFLLWPTVQEWLLLSRHWQAQFALNVTWPEPVSWAEMMERITAVSTESVQLFFNPIQSTSNIDLATMPWAILLGVALIIWVAGNRLLFTNDSGGSHG